MINLPWLFAVNIGNLKTEVYIGILRSHETRIPIHRSGFHGSCHLRVLITAQKHDKLRQHNGVYLGDGPPVSKGVVTPQNYKPCSWRPFGRDPITPGVVGCTTGRGAHPPVVQPTANRLGGWTAWERRSGPAGKLTAEGGKSSPRFGSFFFPIWWFEWF